MLTDAITNLQVAALNTWKTSWSANKAIPLLPPISHLSAGTTLHRLSNPSQKRSLILITCKALSFLWFFFSPLCHSISYWFFCSLLFFSSGIIIFSIHCYITAINSV
jgi:hypothetical protein